MDSNTSAFTIESYGSCNGIAVFSGEFPQLRDHYNFILDTNFKHSKKFSLAIYDLNHFNTNNPEIYFQSYCEFGQPIYSSASSIPYHNYTIKSSKTGTRFWLATREPNLIATKPSRIMAAINSQI